MAEFPALPLWTDAYLGDTTHLTTIEHGAYLLLLMAMWRNNGSLPADDKRLAKYARLTAGQWNKMKPTLMEFFTVSNNEIQQGRLTDEINAVRQNSRRQSDNAKSRWLKNKNTGDATAMPDECQTDAPLPLPISLPKEEKKGCADAPPARYAFAGSIVKVSPSQFDAWKQAFAGGSEGRIRALLQQRDDWLASDEATDDDRKRWFMSTSNWLGNKSTGPQANVIDWDEVNRKIMEA